MTHYGVKTKKEAVDIALRLAVPKRLTLEVAEKWRGIGWDLPDDAFDDLSDE